MASNPTGTPNTLRIAPRPWIGFAVAIAYLAIVIPFTLIVGPDGPEPKTVDWVVANQFVPIGLATVMVVIVISVLGWWRPVLSEEGRKKLPAWLWVIPAIAAIAAIYNFATGDPGAIPTDALLLLALGTALVGIGEELTFRGALLVGLRARFGEWAVWFLTSLVFGSAHLVNIAFGAGLLETLGQVLFAFLVGTAYYITRRVTGTLIVPIVLHFMWDYAGFVSA